MILQNVTVKHKTGQGIYPIVSHNCAFINVRFEKKEVAHQLQMMGETKNVLFENCYFAGRNTILRYDKGFYIPDGERIVFDGTPVSDAVRNNGMVEVRNEPQ